MPPNNMPRQRSDGLRYYMELVTLVITGPTVLSVYVFAGWSLTASIGLTNSFTWSAGPLSNWMIWLILALLFNVVAARSNRQTKFGD